MSEQADEMGELFMEGPSDPDAQATVTDFIDYTEYLPSDLVRSLTLVRGLDKTYLDATASVHELTKAYGELPNQPPESRPHPHVLRKQISEQVRRALSARESAYAESSRLYDVVDRHFDRLGNIRSKLNALYTSIAPEKTTAGPSASGHETKRPGTADGGPTPRITLRVDGPPQKGGTRRQPGATPKKEKQKGRGAARGQKANVVFEPDSAVTDVQESEREEQDGLQTEDQQLLDHTGDEIVTPKKGRPPKGGRMTRSVDNTSVSTPKLSPVALKPPPPDAQLGSEHYPWLRLTDWEMSRLRKKMKKNNIWQPSEIMIQRELTVNGRGWEGYNAAKEKAEATGTELVDCDDIMTNYVPGKLIRKGEIDTEVPGMEEKKTINRGMKLNQAKKQKRENMAREQAALAAAEAEMAAKRLGDIGSTFKSLFSSPAQQRLFDSVHSGISVNSSLANETTATSRSKTRTNNSKKRKFEESPTFDASQDDGTPPASADDTSAAVKKPLGKRLQLSKPSGGADVNVSETSSPAAESTATTKLPSSKRSLPPMSPVEPKQATGETSTHRQGSATSKISTPPATRTSSRRRSIAGVSTDERLRRKSATPATKASTLDHDTTALARTAAGRRSKRPAPGPVTAGQDGGAAVSVGRRKAKPAARKGRDSMQKESSQDLQPEGIRIDEDGVLEKIDPNEPRYCLCGDVSFGTMICCEDNDCDKEWFHLNCIGLPEVPSRLAKWYCPDCRKKLDKIPPDGIVRTSRR